MSNSLTEEVTSLKTKVFNSSLEWNIQKFNEYSKCDIGSIASRKIPIEGTDVYWTLSVFPNGYHSSKTLDNFVSLSLKIHCEKPSQNHCFKVDVKTDYLHNHDDSEYIAEYFVAPREPVEWIVEYENIGKRTHLELYKEDFIKNYNLPAYMSDGTLRLVAKVSMKFVEIIDHVDLIGKNKSHLFC